MALKRPASSRATRALVERLPSLTEPNGCSTVCRKCGHDVTRILRCVATGTLHPVIVDHDAIARAQRQTDVELLAALQAQLGRREAGARSQLYDTEAHEFSTLTMRFVSFDHLTVDRYVRSLKALEAEALQLRNSSECVISPSSASSASRPATASVATSTSTRYGGRQHQLSPIDRDADEYEFGGIRTPKKKLQASSQHALVLITEEPAVPEPRVVARLRELGLTSSTLTNRYPVWVEESPTNDSESSFARNATQARLDAEDRQRRLLMQRLQRCHEASVLSLEVLEQESRCAVELQQHDDFFANILGEARMAHIVETEAIARSELQADALVETDVLVQSSRVTGLVLAAKQRLLRDEATARGRLEFEEHHRGRQRLTERLHDALSDIEDVRRMLEEGPDVIRLRVAVEVCQSVLNPWS